jgi:CRISPR/Cas system Type II protein with McrA/HNH and RuvC-like nuclease domain
MNSLEICQSRLVFVNTWKDTREKDDDYADIVSEVKNKVFGIVGAEIPYFEVSVRKYQNGIAKNKDVLITNSGIQEIKSFLVQYAAEYLEKKYKIDQDELDYLIADIRNQLVHTTESKKKEVQKIQKKCMAASI